MIYAIAERFYPACYSASEPKSERVIRVYSINPLLSLIILLLSLHARGVDPERDIHTLSGNGVCVYTQNTHIVIHTHTLITKGFTRPTRRRK